MRENIGTEFLNQCKENFKKNIPPSIQLDSNDTIVKLAKEYFQEDKLNEFSGFFQEYRFNVNLWTAHLIFDFGNPNEELRNKTLEIIKRYSKTTLDEELAKQEKKWLLDRSIL